MNRSTTNCKLSWAQPKRRWAIWSKKTRRSRLCITVFRLST